MLGISPTAYDLRFRMFGIPIRVHPMFWLAMAILSSTSTELPEMLLWIGCSFVSILVHELGHGLLAQRYSSCREILRYSFGGLCFYSPEPRRTSQQLAIVLAGPGAGFLLCLVFMAGTSVLWKITPQEHFSLAAGIVGVKSLSSTQLNFSGLVKLPTPMSRQFYGDMVFINLMWGLVNLLPIIPLDGGRVTSILLTHFNRFQGQRWTYIVSLLTSGIIAAYVMSWPGEPQIFLILFFGSLAVMNYQSLQAIHQAQISSLSQDDEWWRR
jgi:Zn-dependent protease